MKRATFMLPFPPTVNHLFSTYRGRRIPTRGYKAYRAEADAMILSQMPIPKFTGKVTLCFTIGRPDKRKRDISNLIKAAEDSVVRAGIIEDDSLVESLAIAWGNVEGCHVEIIEWTKP